MKKEVWKDVPGHEGRYQVSDLGNVRSLFLKEPRILKKLLNKRCGYLQIGLYTNNKNKTFKVHQLVAMAFLNHKRCGMKLVIDHINDIKTDNRAENLQIVTNRFNCRKNKNTKNTSVYKGVYWHKGNNKWMSRIQINKKELFLGYFEDEFEANLAYQNKLKEIENN